MLIKKAKYIWFFRKIYLPLQNKITKYNWIYKIYKQKK